MNQKLLFAIASCLLLFATTGYTQQQPVNHVEQQKSHVMQLHAEEMLKRSVRSYWNGHIMERMSMYLYHPEYLVALGISDELRQQIWDAGSQARLQSMRRDGVDSIQNVEFQKLVAEKRAIERESEAMQRTPEFMEFVAKEFERAGRPHAFIGFSPLAPPAVREILARGMDVDRRMQVWLVHHAVNDVLPPEIRQKIKESLLANMSELPIVSPSMFEALGLTDAQKEQMEAIRKELEPEFQKNFENLVSGQMTLFNKALDELAKQKDEIFEDFASFAGRMATVQKELLAENAEYKRIDEELRSQGQSFVAQYKVKLFDVLTEEQWTRLQGLTDSPPEHAKVLREQQREFSRRSAHWQPSAESWIIDEAIPQEYRQRRNGR